MTQETNRPTTQRARWLMLLTLLLAIVQIGAVVRTLQIPGDLAAQISLPLPLEFAASLGWAGLALAVTVALFQRRQRSRPYAAWLLVGFVVYSLARLALFARADYDRQRLPFLLIAFTLLVLAFYIARFVIIRFTETTEDGRKPED